MTRFKTRPPYCGGLPRDWRFEPSLRAILSTTYERFLIFRPQLCRRFCRCENVKDHNRSSNSDLKKLRFQTSCRNLHARADLIILSEYQGHLGFVL